MCRLRLAFTIAAAVLLIDHHPAHAQLSAPSGWGGETIKLPPGFAPDMSLKGVEHIRFAPGMFKPDSDSFFSYALVFELESDPVLTEQLLQDELLKYYRGLCKAVMKGNLGDTDPAKFTLKLVREKKPDQDSNHGVDYSATLDWVEPFATRKQQQLNIEMRTWSSQSNNYLFVCVSPQSPTAGIWQQLRKIRDGYQGNQ